MLKLSRVFLILVIFLALVNYVDAADSLKYHNAKLDDGEGRRITGDEMCKEAGLGRCIEMRKCLGSSCYGDSIVTCFRGDEKYTNGYEWYAICEDAKSGETEPEPASEYTGRGEVSNKIIVISASYGGIFNYRGYPFHNYLSHCNGQISCNYKIDHNVIGDPLEGVAKSFVVNYKCGDDDRIATVDAEASGKNVVLDCSVPVVESLEPTEKRGLTVSGASAGGIAEKDAIQYAGDFNNDGIVDFKDFSLFGDHFGERGGRYDFDNNGIVTMDDFYCFKNKFWGKELLPVSEENCDEEEARFCYGEQDGAACNDGNGMCINRECVDLLTDDICDSGCGSRTGVCSYENQFNIGKELRSGFFVRFKEIFTGETSKCRDEDKICYCYDTYEPLMLSVSTDKEITILEGEDITIQADVVSNDAFESVYIKIYKGSEVINDKTCNSASCSLTAIDYGYGAYSYLVEAYYKDELELEPVVVRGRGFFVRGRCDGITCEPSFTRCPDGEVISCENTCDETTGRCSFCAPDCSGHEGDESSATIPVPQNVRVEVEGTSVIIISWDRVEGAVQYILRGNTGWVYSDLARNLHGEEDRLYLSLPSEYVDHIRRRPGQHIVTVTASFDYSRSESERSVPATFIMPEESQQIPIQAKKIELPEMIESFDLDDFEKIGSCSEDTGICEYILRFKIENPGRGSVDIIGKYEKVDPGNPIVFRDLFPINVLEAISSTGISGVTSQSVRDVPPDEAERVSGRSRFSCSLRPNPSLCCPVGYIISSDGSNCVVEAKRYCADFNSDNKVNFEDFFLLIDAFDTNDVIYDISGDGQVGWSDFFLFADEFGKEPVGCDNFF